MEPRDTTTLLREARTGSSGAREALFARCARKLLPLDRVRMDPGLRSREESDDILQAALLKALAGFEDFRGKEGASLIAWLLRIAENELRDRRDFHGREKRNAAATVALDEAAPQADRAARSALSEVIRSEETRRLEDALLQLGEAHRNVILLRLFEELTFAEAGRRLGRSEDACRMLYARAMAALTLELGAEGTR